MASAVSSSSPQPVTPPSSADDAEPAHARPWPVSSGREPETEPALENTSATVLVTLAATGPSPTASSAG